AVAVRPTGPSELVTAAGVATDRADGPGVPGREPPPVKRSSGPLDGGGGGGGGGCGRGGSALTWILRKRSGNVDWRSCTKSSNIPYASFLYSTSGSFWPHPR